MELAGYKYIFLFMTVFMVISAISAYLIRKTAVKAQSKEKGKVTTAA